jgi:hypothetical protein
MSHKIDDLAVSGMRVGGTTRSLAWYAQKIENHMHNRELWRGIAADQSGDNWAADRLVPYQATSGNNAYGSEIKVIGSDDTPFTVDKLRFDPHRILVVQVSSDNEYKLRFAWSLTTFADAITAGQFAEIMVKFDAMNPQQSAGVPIDVQLPGQPVGTKFWAQAWNTTNLTTISFYIGIHEYEG